MPIDFAQAPAMRRRLCLPIAFATVLLACEKSTPPSTPPDAPADPGGGPVCTVEAKVCPDGSAVGRSGPNCEFAACPGE